MTNRIIPLAAAGGSLAMEIPSFYNFVTVINNSNHVIQVMADGKLIFEYPIYTTLTIPIAPSFKAVNGYVQYEFIYSGGTVSKDINVMFTKDNIMLNQTMVTPSGGSNVIITDQSAGLSVESKQDLILAAIGGFATESSQGDIITAIGGLVVPGDLSVLSTIAKQNDIITAIGNVNPTRTIIIKRGSYTTQQTDTVLWNPTAGKKFVITDILISTDTNGVVTLKDGSTVIRKYYLAPYGGVSENLVSVETSAAADNNLTITTSVVMNLFITVKGYEV